MGGLASVCRGCLQIFSNGIGIISKEHHGKSSQNKCGWYGRSFDHKT